MDNTMTAWFEAMARAWTAYRTSGCFTHADLFGDGPMAPRDGMAFIQAYNDLFESFDGQVTYSFSTLGQNWPMMVQADILAMKAKSKAALPPAIANQWTADDMPFPMLGAQTAFKDKLRRDDDDHPEEEDIGLREFKIEFTTSAIREVTAYYTATINARDAEEAESILRDNWRDYVGDTDEIEDGDYIWDNESFEGVDGVEEQ